MSDAASVLAVFGGSFNPPHLGHALLPAYVLARGEADRVVVAPCWDHPLGKALAPFERRMSWTRLALEHGSGLGPGQERVEVSAIEAELARDRGGRPSYTLDLLEACAARYPESRIRLVVGSDIIQTGETERWHAWERIAARFDPIVVPRAGWAEPGTAALPDISSTVVREQIERLRAGVEVEAARAKLAAMVPSRVARAIERWIEEDELPVWVVGAGHVASHAVPWLRDRGFAVTQVGARALLAGEGRSAGTPVGVWLLCRDQAIEAVGQALIGRLPPGTPVLHGAGARRASEVLAGLEAAGHPVGTLHPICSLRRERRRSRLGSASFGVAGSAAARRFASVLAGDAPILDINHLDGRGRLAYHAACALVANHLAVLEERGAAVLRAQGLASAAVEQALGQLMLSALENLLALGIPAGVTGPLVRGDRATLAAHLAALDDPDTRRLYATLSEGLAQLLQRASAKPPP